MHNGCFLCGCLCPDSVVHLGPLTMNTKDLDAEMEAGTPFGMKLREIALKVEALM